MNGWPTVRDALGVVAVGLRTTGKCRSANHHRVPRVSAHLQAGDGPPAGRNNASEQRKIGTHRQQRSAGSPAASLDQEIVRKKLSMLRMSTNAGQGSYR